MWRSGQPIRVVMGTPTEDEVPPDSIWRKLGITRFSHGRAFAAGNKLCYAATALAAVAVFFMAGGRRSDGVLFHLEGSTFLIVFGITVVVQVAAVPLAVIGIVQARRRGQSGQVYGYASLWLLVCTGALSVLTYLEVTQLGLYL